MGKLGKMKNCNQRVKYIGNFRLGKKSITLKWGVSIALLSASWGACIFLAS